LLGLLELATGAVEHGLAHLVELFLWEAVGAAALEFALGWVVSRMPRSVDNYHVKVLLSLALVAGGYALQNAATDARQDVFLQPVALRAPLLSATVRPKTRPLAEWSPRAGAFSQRTRVTRSSCRASSRPVSAPREPPPP